jgi:hypothetical protein
MKKRGHYREGEAWVGDEEKRMKGDSNGGIKPITVSVILLVYGR